MKKEVSTYLKQKEIRHEKGVIKVSDTTEMSK